MPIKVNLDLLLVKRGMKLTELSEAVGITLPSAGLSAGWRYLPRQSSVGHQAGDRP